MPRKSSKPSANCADSGALRRIYVLDTNVLMHDPAALFRELHLLHFRESKMQPESLGIGHWINAWNSAIVIRASHNELSHRQQHLRSR